MPRVAPPQGPIAPDAQAELDRQMATHGRITNMKRTLSHSPRALIALMEWYPLRDEVVAFLGERATTVFAHAVSTEAECLICSTFFRRILIDGGEDPDHLVLETQEAALAVFGRALTTDQGRVPKAVYDAVAAFLTPAQMVALTTFGAMMIATNIFNNTIEVELDDYLGVYRRPGSVR
jgi:alkylhydroperoxidase family enzyme